MRIIKKLYIFAIIAITLILSVSSSVIAIAAEYTSVYEEVPYDYDTSSIISDLNDGENISESSFFPRKYLQNVFTDNIESVALGTYNFEQDIYVISFVEHGFGTENFGLYIYVYNPNNLNILTGSNKNKVQFTCCGNDNSVFTSTYNKYNLTFIDKTNNNLYLKFKVNGFSSISSSKRYYAISGIELQTSGNATATDYPVGSIYYCRVQDGKTLISRKGLSTIYVDCTHVFYRTDDSVKGHGWSNQLSACYFSLPKEFSFGNNPYGILSEILAEFYLYYTKPILLLNDSSVYWDFYFARGVSTSSSDFKNNPYINCNNLGFRVCYDKTFAVVFDTYYYNLIYNLSYFNANFMDDFNNGLDPFYTPDSEIDALYWLFLDENADFDDPDYAYSAENLKNWYYSYSNSFSDSDLFESRQYFVDNDISLCGFEYGYNKHTYSISAEPEQGAVLGYELTFDSHGFWDSIYEFFGGNAIQTVTGIAPLVRVEYADRNLSKDAFSEKYLVDKSQVDDLKQELTNAGTDREVWLFRYDCSEYYGAKAEVYDKNISNNTYDGLVCQEPVYLDWDILQFTFEQVEIDSVTMETRVKKTNVPVVHDPEDVFSDLTRSKNDFPDDGGCRYTSMLQWLLFCGVAVFIWFVITKIVRAIKGK